MPIHQKKVVLHLLHMKAIYAALTWAAIILILSTISGFSIPDPIPELVGADKLAHGMAYGLLSFLLAWSFWKKGIVRGLLLALVASVFYGVLMEWVQYAFFPHRYFEYYDMLANTIGAVLGIVGFRLLLLFFKIKT